MAICLRRNFRNCGSFAFAGRRNGQTNCYDKKSPNAVIPFVKEITSDFSPPALFRSFSQYPKVMVPQNNAPIWRDTNPSHQSRQCTLNWESRVNSAVLYMDNLMLCTKENKSYQQDQREPDCTPGRPDSDQLHYVSNVLVEDLPKFFIKTMNYKIYHPNVVFENNIRGTKTMGIFHYVRELSIVKLVGRIKFAHVKFQILKITQHPEDGTIRVRWRIIGVSNYKAFFGIFKTMSFTKSHEPEGWYDGFSIFYVRSDGLIHKHTVHKMIPDSEDKVANISNITNNLAAKVAFSIVRGIEDFPQVKISFEEILNNKQKILEVMDPLERIVCFSQLSNNFDMEFNFSDLESKLTSVK